MKVSNSHVRQSKNHTFKYIDGVQYMFVPAAFVYMTKVRYVASKAVAGKIELDPSRRLIEVQEDGTLIYKAL